ncbi:hypothetical protein OUZ56_011636 [Daphnia magna]|uniref:Uncharacterized protein n=1 Tax=Daphnia magna TaxID=35525 RepID=A0ABQ9Z0P7_9CRUS|nr:hypothetical protein OUZ56_011636 [Daphnia magna]
MTITGAWNDRNTGVVPEAILGFREVEGQHSGANKFQVAVDIFKEFDLEEKIFCITSDNAISNSTFLQCLTDYCDNNGLDFKLNNWIRCLVHVIYHSVKEAIKHFKPLLTKLVKVVRAPPQRPKKFKGILWN